MLMGWGAGDKVESWEMGGNYLFWGMRRLMESL
jgi:hypothetical protein